ncbi:MAG: acyl carrier protein [Clostridiales bacterium]|mgnify:FL=1|nr:acyl carrier protein [Clostridiales bacterium]
MASNQTLEKIAALISEDREIDIDSITRETTFEELGLDSLDTVELVMAFEEQFGISIEIDENLRTIGDVADLIDNITG